MGFADQKTEQKVPFPYDKTFDSLVKAIPRAGFNLGSQDRVLGRITASAGISLMSFGENMTLIVEKIDPESTLVKIESSLKVGANVFGASKHQKNFNAIMAALSSALQGNEPETWNV